MIDANLVEKLAHLARLGLSPEEIQKFSGQIDDILVFFDKLQEVDTEGVEEVSHITGLQNILREDVIEETVSSKDILSCTPHSVVENQIIVPKAL